MIVNDNDARRPETAAKQPVSGWTSLHSWIFLAIVAIGLLVVGIQNRYHYLNPLGLGKAYRIDKLFGGIQEFDPEQGWIKAQLKVSEMHPNVSMMSPQPSGSQAAPMNMPGTLPTPGGPPQPSVAQTPSQQKQVTTPEVTTENIPGQKPETKKEASTENTSLPPEVSVTPPPTAPELSEEQRFAMFKKDFPDFGKDEFQLANDDLYPDWKKNSKPNGTWQEFLGVYKKFIQWWLDAGSPAESGMVLWKKFMAASGKN